VYTKCTNSNDLFFVQGDQKVSLNLMITALSTLEQTPQTDYLKITITEYIRNVDRAIMNTEFENTFGRVNKCLETGGGNFELNL
jgi:hypothetical protein